MIGYERARDSAARARILIDALPAEPGYAVDVGAGSGWLTEALTAAGWTVDAIEADPDRAEAIRARVPAASVLTELVAGGDLPNRCRGADAVFALSVLHHLDDPRHAALRLLEVAPLVVVETPHPIEAAAPDVAGGPACAVLHDLLANRRPHVLGYSPSAYAAAHRPLFAWDRRLTVGTVTTGAGWTSQQWDDVGARAAAAIGVELYPGSLNLELDQPWDPPAALHASTEAGPVALTEVTINRRPAWAAIFPESDRGPLHVEVLAAERLRDTLALDDGHRVFLRQTPPTP